MTIVRMLTLCYQVFKYLAALAGNSCKIRAGIAGQCEELLEALQAVLVALRQHVSFVPFLAHSGTPLPSVTVGHPYILHLNRMVQPIATLTGRMQPIGAAPAVYQSAFHVTYRKLLHFGA